MDRSVVVAARFIPARAGNTHVLLVEVRRAAGSSPRGRGTHRLSPPWRRCRRFIPARAGNTTRRIASRSRPAVHPRAGGEHSIKNWLINASCGSSPRGRGTHRQDGHQADNFSVHPRAGGEHISRASTVEPQTGSSPRGRGTPSSNRFTLPFSLVHPRAGGEHAASNALRVSLTGFIPRAGGEHMPFSAVRAEASGSSPRGRGTLDLVGDLVLDFRFIPARAGNTDRGCRSTGTGCGSSPRGRGTPCVHRRAPD